jgi:choline dehydrogenase-like flavoprotein
MIVPLASVQARYDACVIGAGPAGITVVLELSKLRPEWRILVVEYGKSDGPNDLDDSIRISNPLNHHDPYDCTNKGLGGTSQTWGGRCVSYDQIDFVPRAIVGNECTWDEALFDEVKGFYRQAAEYLDCGEPVFSLHDPQGGARPIVEGFIEGDVLDSPLERWSLPTRFDRKYGALLGERPCIDVVSDCMADRLIADNGRVTELEVVDRKSGEQKRVKADRFIVAAGAQETTRLLLKSPQVFKVLGGPPPALGRYYQGHLSGKIASVKFSGDPKRTDYGFTTDPDGVFLRRRFQFSGEAIGREELLNTAIWLDNPPYWDPAHRSGTMSLIYLAMITPMIGRKLAPSAIAESVTKGRAYKVGTHILNVLRGLPGSILEPLSIFRRRYTGQRRLPGVFLYSARNEYALHFHAEQVPRWENSMLLADDGKTLTIDFSYSALDVESVIKCHEILDRELRKVGVGELVYWHEPAVLRDVIVQGSKDGIHQVGTTRISETAESGVVDRDLKVWGTENLYVCSSSAFPTSSQANPTFLLVAFAVRLSSRLARP